MMRHLIHLVSNFAAPLREVATSARCTKIATDLSSAKASKGLLNLKRGSNFFSESTRAAVACQFVIPYFARTVLILPECGTPRSAGQSGRAGTFDSPWRAIA